MQLAGIAGTCPPPIPVDPAIAVFAGDHGVVASGVTPWPQDITAGMVGVMAGGGAAINVLRATPARRCTSSTSVSRAISVHSTT